MNSNLVANERIEGPGFLAALDQSGGSTPKALKEYGYPEADIGTGDAMFQQVHDMRTRIITNPAFDHRISGAILFADTMRRNINGTPTAQHLWTEKGIVPFLKIDDGLQPEANGAQLMKPIADLDNRLAEAKNAYGIYGTKMRSVIKGNDPNGIGNIVDQQFDVASQIQRAGLMPIIEPEVDIHAHDKFDIEAILKDKILGHLDKLGEDEKVMLKLTLPDQNNLYKQLVEHPRVLRVVALSGGYSRAEANSLLSRNDGVTASFSRALAQDLRLQQNDAEFTAALEKAIASIYEASVNKKVA